jgi:hypothetical protein
MTVSSTTTKNSYSGNGSLTVFAYGFKIFDEEDIEVILRNDTTGTETVQTITTNYSVSNVGNANGGNVTFVTAPASGITVVLRRASPLTQTTDYTPNDPFPAESHEDALDKLTFISQQIQEEVDRSIKLSRTNTMTSTEFTVGAADRANKILAFDGNGEINVAQELVTDQYLGSLASDPTTDLDGNALTDGDLYFNTTDNVMKVYDLGNTTWKQLTPTAGQQTNIDTVSGIAGNVTTVAGISGDVTTVSGNTANIGTVAGSISNVNAVGTNITSVVNAANSIASINNFGDTYFVSATAPASPTLGDLWFDTANNIMKVYGSGGFVNAGSSVNGTANRYAWTVGTASGTYTGSTTVFPATYDAGYADVFLNGVKLLVGTDVTATNGTDVTLATAAAANDIVEIVAYGTFTAVTALSLGDNEKIQLGASQDLQIYHDGSNSIINDAGTGSLKFQYGGTDGVVFDSSGNFLVGKASAGLSNVGFQALSSGVVGITRSGSNPLDLNRLVSDGTLIEFNKDGTIVGDIGVNNGDNLRIQGNSSHSGIEFGTDAIFPHKNSLNVDATIDLGESTLRWRDIYLSGGVLLGGTGSANYLNDYEVGTWTPQIWKGTTQVTSPTAALGQYRKIGDVIFYSFYFFKSSGSNTDSNLWNLRGLPFAMENAAVSGYTCLTASYTGINSVNHFDAGPHRWQNNGSSYFELYGAQQTTQWTSGHIEFAGYGFVYEA